jgi:hypothetical protein
MKLKSIASFLIITLLLAACGNPMPTMVPGVTENPTVPPTQPSAPITYPAPGTPVPTTSAYPEPGNPGTGTPVIPPSGYEPQPGDNNLKRDQVFLDLVNSQFSLPDTPTSQVQVVLQGNLPDPCHRLRVVVTPPDANNVINLDAYSVVNPAGACITVLKPFVATIPLGSYTDGEYTVMVNGERLGLFSVGSGIAPAVQVTP